MKLLADTSVWVDYLRGSRGKGAEALDRALGHHSILLGDLVLVEILRGVPDEKTAHLVKSALDQFDTVELGGKAIAVAAAEHYRLLRSKGVTVRGTVDLLIGTWCIAHDIPLLHADRDYEAMEKWLGLRRWVG